MELHLVTVPTKQIPSAPIPGIKLESDHFKDGLSFPPFGQMFTSGYPVPQGQFFRLKLTIDLPAPLSFQYNNLGSDDIVVVSAIGFVRFFSNVMHLFRPAALIGVAPCIAECADGTKGQGCVECRAGSASVRVCC